jgi:hypothetical protein
LVLCNYVLDGLLGDFNCLFSFPWFNCVVMGGMRIGKKPKKHDSIWCPQCKGTNAETLKWQRTIGEGDQELQKRSVQEEST